MRISIKNDPKINIYSGIIKEYLAKGIIEPNRIFLALLKKFIDRADAKSFLYRNTHKHAAFCRSCFVDEQKSEQKNPEEKKSEHKDSEHKNSEHTDPGQNKVEEKKGEEKSVSIAKQQLKQLTPNFVDINGAVDALNRYCKDKSIDSNGEFAMMLCAFFSVYGHYSLEKSLRDRLILLDRLEILMDIPRLEGELRFLLNDGASSESLMEGIKLLFRLMSTQQKMAWVATQLRDLTDKDTGWYASRVRYHACSMLYNNREDIPSACWPKIIECLTNCLLDEEFSASRSTICKLVAEYASHIPKDLWPKVIEKFLIGTQLPGVDDYNPGAYSLFIGDAATYIPQEFWPNIIRHIHKIYDEKERNFNKYVWEIISKQFNHVPKDIRSDILNAFVKEFTFSHSWGCVNDDMLLKQCLPLLSNDQWGREIIPLILFRYSFSRNEKSYDSRLSYDKCLLVERVVPHIPNDLYLWPQLIEKVFCMKDEKEDTDDDIVKIFAAHIPPRYWNGIIKFLLSKLQKNPIFESFLYICAPYIPADEWQSIFDAIKKQLVDESKASEKNRESKDCKDSKEMKESQSEISSNSNYPIVAISALGLGLAVMPDQLKSEVTAWLLDQFKNSDYKNRPKFYKLLESAAPHVPKNLISQVINNLLPFLGRDRWDDRYFSPVFAALLEYIKRFSGQEDNVKLWTEFFSNFFNAMSQEEDSSCSNFFAAIMNLAPDIPKKLWPEIINNLVMDLRSPQRAKKALFTLIRCMPSITAVVRLDVLKMIIASIKPNFKFKQDICQKIGKCVAKLPEADRADFIEALLSEYRNDNLKAIIVSVLRSCKEEIPDALLGDVARALLSQNGIEDVFNFLSPPVGQRLLLDVRPLVIDYFKKYLLSEEDRLDWPNRHNIMAGISLAQYPDSIIESLWPKVIHNLIAGLASSDMELRILAARSLMSCHTHMSDLNWDQVFSLLGENLTYPKKYDPDNLFTLFGVFASHIPPNIWMRFVNFLCISPDGWHVWGPMAQYAGHALTSCIPHVPKAMRYEVCLSLLKNIDKNNYRNKNPVIEAFRKLVPMLERHEYIYIMSNLVDKVINFKSETSNSCDRFDYTWVHRLELLTEIHEQIGPEKALDVIFKDDVEKIILGYLP